MIILLWLCGFTVLTVASSLSSGGESVYDRTIYVDRNDPDALDTPECWEGNADLPCQTLNYALLGLVNSTQVILLEGGQYELISEVSSTVFHGMNDLAIIGETETVINCSVGTGLTFTNSDGIILQNVCFSGCGALHNSTSRNFNDTSSYSFLEFQVSLYFLFCQNINLNHVTVSRSNGTGAVMYGTVGNITVHN